MTRMKSRKLSDDALASVTAFTVFKVHGSAL